MSYMKNRPIKIKGVFYKIIGCVGDYYKCESITPPVIKSDGIESEFSHPTRIYYDKKLMNDYYLGNRKWLV